jgi:hypothetical protein
MAASSNPNRTGTRIGGTSHGLMRSMSAMCRSLQKKSLASARLQSSQSGELLLLLGLAGVLLDIALVLLRGGLGLARRDGLGGFIGTLLLVGHKYSFCKSKNTIFKVLFKSMPIPEIYNGNSLNIYSTQNIGPNQYQYS